MDAASNGSWSTTSSGLSSLLSISTSTAASSTPSHTSEVAEALEGPSSSSWLGLLGRLILVMARVLPSILYWIITFSTITLPTVLFTLFSTSLTFTMNMTTLYVWPVAGAWPVS